MPTQNAASPSPVEQSTLGWTQLPDALENCCVLPLELPPATYPDQLALDACSESTVAAEADGANAIVAATAVAARVEKFWFRFMDSSVLLARKRSFGSHEERVMNRSRGLRTRTKRSS